MKDCGKIYYFDDVSKCTVFDPEIEYTKAAYWRFGQRFETHNVDTIPSGIEFQLFNECGELICIEAINRIVTSKISCTDRCGYIFLNTRAEFTGEYQLIVGNYSIKFGALEDYRLRLPNIFNPSATNEFTIIDPFGNVVVNEYSEVTEISGEFCNFVINRAKITEIECVIRLCDWAPMCQPVEIEC